jgi:hypothetical protein
LAIMTFVAALLAAGTAPAPLIQVAPIDYRLPPPKHSLRIVPGCEAAEGEILVCGRRPAFRLDSHAAVTASGEGRLLDIEIAPGVRLGGGGPKGSVGLGLTIAF